MLKVSLSSTFIFLLFLLTSLLISPVYASEPIVGWASVQNAFPHILASAGGAIGLNKLFTIGGATLDDYNEVYSFLIGDSGMLSNWSLEANGLPETRYGISKSTVQNGNNIYVLGGNLWDGQEHYQNTVYFTTVKPDGTIGNWTSLNPLPVQTSEAGAVILNNRVYYAGGYNSLGKSNGIYYANINSDGTIGNWIASSILLPQPMDEFEMVAYKDYIIILGGRTSNEQHLSSVYRSLINPDGSLNSWEPLTSLPLPLSHAGVIVVGSNILSIGGETDQGFVRNIDNVYYTSLDQEGNINKWESSLHNLPQGVGSSTVLYINGYVYLIGGYGTGYLNTIYYTRVSFSPDLPVPSLKQTSDPWQSQEYDGADLWSPKYPSINAWGCALTSATMIFEYYGINKLPDGTPLDPGTLNTWLKNNNGYDDGVNNGYILPPTYARFSKLAAPANNVTAFDALETQVVPGNDKNQLTADLQATMPAMLGVVNNSHYVVAKGINGSTFDINDPYFDRNTLNDGYANTFSSLTRFIPSHTDLSYMLFTTKSDITFSLKNSSGSAVGVQFIQPPLLSDPNGTPSGQASKVFLFQKPIAGQYTLTLTGTPGEKYQLNSYFYDKNGNIDTIKQSDVIGSTNENIYTVNFDQNIATKSAIFRNKGQKKSCEKLEEDIERFKQHHTIKAYLADVIIGLTHNMRCDKDDKHFHPFVPQYVWWFITLQKNQFSPQIFDTLHQDFNEIF